MSFEALFDNASRLPSIPKILQELILSFSDSEIDMESIAKKVALEPVLTAKILRVANSARYGSPRKISSVQEATVLLGYSAVRQIVLACGLVDSLDIPPSVDKTKFWHKAFSVAGCSKWLCQYSGRNENTYDDADTVFTAGLIHSTGELLMYVVYPDKAKEVSALVEQQDSLFNAQEKVYGYTHCAVGEELAKRWRFPDPICTALAQQHAPLTFTPPSILAMVLRSATLIVRDFEKYNEGNDDRLQLKDTLPDNLIDALKLDIDSMTEELNSIESFDGGMLSLLGD